jgi:hypothetical protein
MRKYVIRKQFLHKFYIYVEFIHICLHDLLISKEDLPYDFLQEEEHICIRVFLNERD